MKGKEDLQRTLKNKLTGLHQCISEMETSEEDLLAALGARNRDAGEIAPDLLASEIENFLVVLAKTVESREARDQGHLDRVAAMAVSLGREMGLSEGDLRALRLGSLLHDIGKIGLLLRPPDRETAPDGEEGEILKRHPEIGYHLCLPLKTYLGAALDIIGQHHERLDGSGYPRGLKGTRISLGARIVGIVDLFDVRLRERPGQGALSLREVLDLLRQEAGEGKLDQRVVDALAGLCIP